MTNKVGRPERVLTKEEQDIAIVYILKSGFWKMRLADFLEVDIKTLNKNLTDNFSQRIRRANADFLGKTIARANPEFILKNKAGKEFSNKQQYELTGRDGGPVEVSMPKVESILKKRLKQIDAKNN